MGKVDTDPFFVHPGMQVDLSKFASLETQGWDEEDMKEQIEKNAKATAKLQEKLYAEDSNSILLVFQAMDAGGKDSTIKKITKYVNPAGVTVASFKAPSMNERDRDFLHRIHMHAPNKGNIAIFNRSHYEDVIITRARELFSLDEIDKRYDDINAFEKYLSNQGVHIIKFMLHISPEYQMSRFKHRLSNPEKKWKFSVHDLEERQLWDKYQEAFETALTQCSTDHAPWYVIPAENKPFRCLTIGQILRAELEKIDPQYPDPDFDPEKYNLNLLEDFE